VKALFTDVTWGNTALEAAEIITAINDKPAGRGRLWEPWRDKMMHALRHLYASERMFEDMDIATLAERLSHSGPAYTPRSCVHQVTEGHKEERRFMGRALRGTTNPRPAADVGCLWASEG
jgi:hypothetical protein